MISTYVNRVINALSMDPSSGYILLSEFVKFSIILVMINIVSLYVSATSMSISIVHIHIHVIVNLLCYF
jgi:hypothetical protein